MADSASYLKQVIGLDAGLESAEILRLRSEQRGVQGTKGKPKRRGALALNRAPNRPQLEEQLTGIGSTLFDASAADLDKRLRALDIDAYPDLERRKKRYFTVVAARDDIDAAGEHPKTDEHFFQTVLKLLARSQREGVEVKARLLNQMRGSKRRKDIQRSIRTWKASFPALYALEAPWFEQLMKAKAILKSRKKPAAIGFFFIVWIVLQLVKAISNNG
jgi:hypothetical protein